MLRKAEASPCTPVDRDSPGCRSLSPGVLRAPRRQSTKETAVAQILVVDDDPDIQEACRLVLEKEGHVVRCASNRAGGLEAVAAAAPDLLILDVMMEEPDDGLTMARQLRKQGFEGPIIMLTSVNAAMGLQIDRDDEMVPVEKFQPKPVEPKVLVAEVDELLGG
jgi:two-component system, OmpR family, response regulator